METISGYRIHGEASQGRQSTMTAKADRYLSITAKRSWNDAAFQISRDFYVTTVRRVSKVTVFRRLHEKVLFSEKTFFAPLLICTNKRARLALYRYHWDFSPLSAYPLILDMRSYRKQRILATCPAMSKKSNNHGSGGLIVWEVSGPHNPSYLWKRHCDWCEI